jgi:hypothetical protein
MALITSRTLGLPLDPEAIRKFVPVPPAATAAAEADQPHVVHVEIIDNPDGTHGCYTEFEDGTAICEPC